MPHRLYLDLPASCANPIPKARRTAPMGRLVVGHAPLNDRTRNLDRRARTGADEPFGHPDQWRAAASWTKAPAAASVAGQLAGRARRFPHEPLGSGQQPPALGPVNRTACCLAPLTPGRPSRRSILVECITEYPEISNSLKTNSRCPKSELQPLTVVILVHNAAPHLAHAWRACWPVSWAPDFESNT